jgi:hypothetical protein
MARSWFLAGPLGFEPRQSAPKALDLPLVDGPVNQCQVSSFLFQVKPCARIILWKLETGNWKLSPVLPSRQGSSGHGRYAVPLQPGRYLLACRPRRKQSIDRGTGA